MKSLIRVLLLMTLVTGQVVVSNITLAKNHLRRWTTYRNERFGFSIKCPSVWQVNADDAKPSVIIYPRNPKPHEFYIAVSFENRTMGQVREAFTEFTRRSPASRYNEHEIRFANERAYQFTRTDYPGFYLFYIPLSDKLFVVCATRFDISEVRRAVRTFRLRRA